jgi:hypothetical protein
MYTIEQIAKLAEDFTETHLTTPELKQRFIDQMFGYVNDCCETERELCCFIDGLLMNIYN